MSEDAQVVAATRLWVETLVVGLNLCPFAKRELVNDRVRFAATAATTAGRLLTDLRAELELLNNDVSVETTLLIHPQVLQDFRDYNQFLNDADAVLTQMELEGVYQVASFHPEYQFAGTCPEDAENYTNRSPFPMLHLIREASLERAIAEFPDTDQIPAHNIELTKRMGSEKLRELIAACLNP